MFHHDQWVEHGCHLCNQVGLYILHKLQTSKRSHDERQREDAEPRSARRQPAQEQQPESQRHQRPPVNADGVKGWHQVRLRPPRRERAHELRHQGVPQRYHHPISSADANDHRLRQLVPRIVAPQEAEHAKRHDRRGPHADGARPTDFYRCLRGIVHRGGGPRIASGLVPIGPSDFWFLARSNRLPLGDLYRHAVLASLRDALTHKSLLGALHIDHAKAVRVARRLAGTDSCADVRPHHQQHADHSKHRQHHAMRTSRNCGVIQW